MEPLLKFLIFIVEVGILISIHEFGHFIMAKRMGVRVDQFSLGFGPKIFGWKKANTEYSICIIPLGGYVKLSGDNPEEFKGQPDEYLAKSVRQRAGIVICGPLLNYLFAFICFWLVFFLGFPNLSCRVGDLVENFGAQEAGIQVGDKIIAVDGQEVRLWQELQGIINKKKEGQVVTILILRNNEQLKIPVKIKQKEVDIVWGTKKTVGLIGIQPAEEFIKVRYGFIKSFFMGGQKLFYLTWLTYKSLAWMVLGKLPLGESVTGIFGLYHLTGEVVDLGFIPFIHFIAIISLSLAIFNLLPIPVLDGGHLLFLFIEKIRRRRLSSQIEKLITQIGFSIILLLLVFVFYNDLLKFNVFDKILKLWSG